MKCPGQDTKYWKQDAIFEEKCPKCGRDVEFFKDDTSRKCPHCDHRFVNPKMDFGCAAYCQFAEQCIGTLPAEVVSLKDDFLKDKIAVEMKKHYKRDFKKIGFASRTARYAEQIGKSHDVNTGLVIAAGYLIGMASNGEAKSVMENAGAPAPFINKVVNLLKDLSNPENNESPEFKVIHDAYHLCLLENEIKNELANESPHRFMTESARILAEQILKT